ncbi:cytochrome P450 [Nocardioides sp. CBS4Y-1]|uniref:Cytochrome P450 n=2 Tax=Nocardioides acrostichi TaxID=2784339 RepID=A0A930UWC9_9ACTN|nr:cytochrome P450 [Nocardioides acrostichi]
MLDGIPHEQFEAARATAPVHWVEQEQGAYDGMSAASGSGYFAVTRHADIAAISKDTKRVWSTEENGAIIRFKEGMERAQVELQRAILINQDAPGHTQQRGIIGRGFTPRSVNELEEVMVQRAHTIVQDALTSGRGDFVQQVAAELPLQAIADLIGVPQEDRFKLFDWSNQMLAYDDPEFDGDPETASVEILSYAMMMAADRKANPRDDIVTKLINAHKGDRGLTDDEFGFFVILLAVAGNETTRNAITHGMQAFFDNPEQWELWKKERPATMVDEVVRWSSPVAVFQRTALEDTEISGVPVAKGQRAALFYASGNFDAEVFENPFTFDITRDPNPHLGFGGHGAHYCLGANLARQEIRIIFDVLADLAPDIHPISDPERLRHAWIHGIKRLEVGYR